MNHEEIAAYYKAGHSLRECGEYFGLSMSRIHQILKAKYPDILRKVGDTRQHSSGVGSGHHRRRDLSEGV